MLRLPFALNVGPASFFEKANHGAKERCVAGVLSTGRFDVDRESLAQGGLDFSYFLHRGVLNDNHDRSVAAIVGYPTSVQDFAKGAGLPDDTKAAIDCTWAEGLLLENDERADAVWRKGLALRGTPRALGFSIEGKALARQKNDPRIVLKAEVYNAAICGAPKNLDSKLSLFQKGLLAIEDAGPEELELAWAAFHKALGLGEASPSLPEGAVEAEQAGRLLSRRDQPRGKRKRRRELTKAEASALVLDWYPDLSSFTARRVVELISAAYKAR